jgi:hypothetical protein
MRSARPSAYTFAVLKKFTPPSKARRTRRSAVD